jgi:hypothetical protein
MFLDQLVALAAHPLRQDEIFEAARRRELEHGGRAVLRGHLTSGPLGDLGQPTLELIGEDVMLFRALLRDQSFDGTAKHHRVTSSTGLNQVQEQVRSRHGLLVNAVAFTACCSIVPSRALRAFDRGTARSKLFDRGIVAPIMFEAYFDEIEGGGVYLIAGWVARSDVWSLFEPDWRTALSAAPALDTFRHHDAIALKGRRLNRCRAHRKIEALVEFICSQPMHGITVRVRVETWNRAFESNDGARPRRGHL